MRYESFHVSRIGASHIRRERPCQDASVSEAKDGVYIAIVADGHGSRRHFRSDRGSAIACQVALEHIENYLGNHEFPDDDNLYDLKQSICNAWLNAVRDDFDQNPWTEEELEEERSILTEDQFEALEEGTDGPIAYGSTLCAVFANDDYWAVIQLGDGCFVHIDEDGLYDWPMPESFINEGNTTASLCMHDPMRDFRHCWGEDTPAGLLVFTDGIEKVFPPQGKEVVSLLHWIWRNQYDDSEKRESNLVRTLDMLTQRSPIGDDVSVAGIINPEAEDAEPKASQTQKRQELERLYAQIREIRSTIEYNEQRLQQAYRSSEDRRSGAVEQLQLVIERKRMSERSLLEQTHAIEAELYPESNRPVAPEPEKIEDIDMPTDQVSDQQEDVHPQVSSIEDEPLPFDTIEDTAKDFLDIARKLFRRS